MADGQLRAVIGQLRRLIGGQGGSTLSDAQLLDAFVARRDEAAFEVLVWRHGTMVFNLCQRILRDAHQAEDAFQATFLVFVRKAASIGKRESLGSWLYKVAFRIACRARARSVKNVPGVADIDGLSAGTAPDEDVVWRDLKPVLDEEINRLPEKFRAPFVLCHLQGHTNEEAARMLGCPKGTILSRLARGREKLRSRLARRGVALSAAWLTLHLSTSAASAAVPAGLVGATIKASLPFAAGAAASGLVSASVASLTEGTLHAMFLTKVKLAACAVLLLAVLGAGGGSLAHWALAATPDVPVAQAAPIIPPEPPKPQAETERKDAAEAPQQPGPPDNDEQAQTHTGRVVSVPADGKGIVLELSPPGRDMEAKRLTVSFGPKTTFVYSGVAQGGARPTEGYAAVVRIEKNETVSVIFHGDESGRNGPELTGKVTDVAADGNSFTLEEAATGRQRNEAPRKTLLHLSDKSLLVFSAVAAGGAKLSASQRVQVWLADDPARNVVAQAQCIGPDDLQAKRGDPAPNWSGRIVRVSRDGKSLTLSTSPPGRDALSQPATEVEVKLEEATSVVFQNALAGGTKIVPGQQAAVWLTPGSKELAAKVGITGAAVPERWESLTGNVVAISNDAKRLTLEVRLPQPRDGGRGEPRSGGVKKIDILLTPRTQLSFQGVGPDEATIAVGYAATVRLADGSQDVAAQILFTKPGAAPRVR